MSFGTIANNFETGLASGTGITAANSGGGTAGTAFTVVTANGAITYDNTEIAHGSLAAKFVTGTTGANVLQYGSGVLTGAPTTFYFRANLYLPSLPAVAFRVAKFEGGSNALIGELDINSSGKMQLRDATGTVQYTSTSAIPTGQWVRIEGKITVGASTGQVELKLFAAVDSTTATEDDTITSLNLSANGLNFSQFGSATTTSSSVTFWLDDLAISDTAWLGAVNPSGGGGGALGTIANNFETGLASGTTISAANSGNGTAGTAFSVVTIGAGAALTFDNTHVAHGSLAAELVTGTTAASVLQWGSAVFPVTPTTFYFRINLYLPALPAAAVRLAKFEGGANVLIGELDVNTSGKLVFRDSAGTAQLTQTNAIPTGQWVRIEGKVVVSATVGSIELQLYNSLDGVLATEDDTASNLNLTANGLNFVQFGSAVTTASSVTLWLDDLAITDQAWLGPAGTPPKGIALGTIAM
jgi:hypothetical protein